MKKIINAPENYTDDMLRGIYAAHPEAVKYVADDLRCYCTAKKKDSKVAIITGGGTGHLPLFLGYVGEGLLDGCGVGGVFQSPSAEQIYNVSKEVEAGAGILYLYGNYTGDIMNFDMAAEMCEMDDIETRSIVGADDVNSNADPATRRGVAGIFFMYKCAGAKAAQMGSLDEVLAAAQKAKDNTRTVGFALTPCIILPHIQESVFDALLDAVRVAAENVKPDKGILCLELGQELRKKVHALKLTTANRDFARQLRILLHQILPCFFRQTDHFLRPPL